MDEALKERPTSVDDGEVGRIEALEGRIASPGLKAWMMRNIGHAWR